MESLTYQTRRGFVMPWTKPPQRPRGRRDDDYEGSPNRLPFLDFLPHGTRSHFIAMLGEFIGTFLFLFFAFAGTQVANNSNAFDPLSKGSDVNVNMYISLSFGFSLAVNAWTFFRISGGLFNPAVALGMMVVGAISWVRGCLTCISQILGGMAAAGVVSAVFPGELTVNTVLTNGTSVSQGLFIEMFLTAQLVFTIFMLAAEKHKATFIAPIGIGLSLFIAELAGAYFTGGSLNPARSFGPCVVIHAFPGYHWIYWIGPFLGALLAAAFYKLIKMLEYETANPGQDNNEEEEAAATESNKSGSRSGYRTSARASRERPSSGRAPLGANSHAPVLPPTDTGGLKDTSWENDAVRSSFAAARRAEEGRGQL